MVLVVGFAVHWSFYLARQRADQFDDVSRVDIVRAVAEVVSENPHDSFKRWLRSSDKCFDEKSNKLQLLTVW